MRWILTCLLLLGLLAGQSTRAMGWSPCEDDHSTMVEHSGHSHDDHGHEHPCTPEQDDKCPLEHHHHDHGFCCHPMPMAATERDGASVIHLPFSLSPVRDDHQRAPDSPCSKLDKPPLI